VTGYLIFPKLLCEDWTWRARCDYSWLRRGLVKLLVTPRPIWDQSLPWDTYKASNDWGMTRFSVVKLEETNEGLGMRINFRDVTPEAPWPAIAKNGDAPHPVKQEALSPAAAALALLVERAGGSQGSLLGLDSLQVITLAELIRKEMGKDVSVKDLLRHTSIKELAAHIETTTCSAGCGSNSGEDEASAQGEKPDAFGSYRVFTMAFPRHPVDWCVRYDGPGHIDVAALQHATDRLVARHSALRTVETPDEPLREAMDKAAALWQLCSSSVGRDSRLWRSLATLVGGSLYACWPRTVLRSAEEARVEAKTPKGPRVREASWDKFGNDEYIFSSIKEATYPVYRWPFEICLVPLYKGEPEGTGKNAADFALRLPPEDVTWYIYCSITHAYSDGASGQALIADLIRYYKEACNKSLPVEDPPVPEVLQLLQARLRPSLRGRLNGQSDPNSDVFHEVLDEDFVKRGGYSRRIFLEPQVSQSLRVSSSDVLGCSVDVAWLTAVMGTCFRLFPDQPCFHLVLKCGCRDGPSERQMVGFLSENRIFSVDVGEVRTSTLVDIANLMAGTRRQRAWRAPLPLESGMTIYVNIVSAMAGSLPKGFEHVPKPAPNPNRWAGPAYAHLNLRIDQLATDDWDVRVFHYDDALGWEWNTHFAHALGGTIYDMVAAPTESLALPPHRREGGGWPIWPSTWTDASNDNSNVPDETMQGADDKEGLAAGVKRREPTGENGEAAATDTEEPPAKAPRLDDHSTVDVACTEDPYHHAIESTLDVEEPVAKAPRQDEATYTAY